MNTDIVTGWAVEIVEYKTGKVVRSIPCSSEKQANTVDNGINRQMDTEKFYTRIVGPVSEKID